MQLKYLKSKTSTSANISTKCFAISILMSTEYRNWLIQNQLAWTFRKTSAQNGVTVIKVEEKIGETKISGVLSKEFYQYLGEEELWTQIIS